MPWIGGVVGKKKDQIFNYGPGIRVSNANKNDLSEAYRSSLGNLYTSNDPTLSTTGAVEKLTVGGYYGDVIKSLKVYETDPVVKKLIDESVLCANTKFMFSAIDNDEDSVNIIKEWSERINEGIPNVVPGINSITEWMLSAFFKTGMAVPDFEWGNMKIGEKTYQMPTKLIVHPSLAIKLKSDPLTFGKEEVWLGMSQSSEQLAKQYASSDKSYKIMYCETQWDKKKNTMNQIWHNIKGTSDTLCVYKPNAFALKYKWDFQHPSYYPIPPLKPIFKSIAMKHKLQDADMSLLQRVISRIIQVKVGDKDNLPKPDVLDKHGNLIQKGTLTQYAEMWQDGDTVQIFTTDYTVDIKDIMPDISLVLNQAKYQPSLSEIMGAFGIMQDPDLRSGSNPHTQMNLVKYEKFLIDLQKIIVAYFNMVVKQIDEKNSGIKHSVKITMISPNIDPTVEKSLSELYKDGVIDPKTLLESMNLDYTQIKQRKIDAAADVDAKGDPLWVPAVGLVQINKNNQAVQSQSSPDAGAPTNIGKNKTKDNPVVKQVKQ